MEERELKELVSLFEQSSLQVMEIEKKDDSLRIRMEKGGAAAAVSDVMQAVPEAAAAAPAAADGGSAEDSGFEKVTAPLVGTFYEAPAPGAAPFTVLGQKVEKGQTLCLIEAMKMMNELKSPADGIIRRIGSENGQLVEFGQVLFEVEPC